MARTLDITIGTHLRVRRLDELVVSSVSVCLRCCLGGCIVAGGSHGLGCTAASNTSAAQSFSLSDSPERPRAAKSALMARVYGAAIRQLAHSSGEWVFTLRICTSEPRYLFQRSTTLQVPDGVDDTLKVPEQFYWLRCNLLPLQRYSIFG